MQNDVVLDEDDCVLSRTRSQAVNYAYSDYADDKELFNGSISCLQYTGGTFTGAVLGAGVGAVATAGIPSLIGGISSVCGKFVSDFVAYEFFDKTFGSWEDYAVAFIFGGLAKGFGLGAGAIIALDVYARPAFNQLVKAGIRGKDLNLQKYAYDITIRAFTYYMPKDLKPIIRGLLGGYYDFITKGNNSYNYISVLLCC